MTKLLITSHSYAQRVINNIIMCGLRDTSDNGCCMFTPVWLQEQVIRHLKEAGDRPALLRKWKLVDLYQVWWGRCC